jgi:hypothetical protein
MADKIQCDTHGECFRTFVCTHLLGETAGLGFNSDEPRTTIRSLTRGATTAKSYVQFTMAGTKSPKSFQKSHCSAQAAMNEPASAIPGLQSHWMIWLIFAGSAVVAMNGILALASTLAMMHRITR